MTATIYASWETSAEKARAQRLSRELGLPLISKNELPEEGYALLVTQEKLLLEFSAPHQHKHQLYAEFLKGPLGYRRRKGGGLKQALCKAVGVKTLSDGLKVLDGTAGLGKDAFILASVGCKVVALERSKIMFALCQDGLARASLDENVGPIIRKNLYLLHGDLRNFLEPYLKHKLNPASKNSLDDFDVIYLDPMFPPRKKSALTKLEMRIIHDIVGKDEDMDSMLTEALKVAKKRVVVKRPAHAPHLQNKLPSFIVSGKTNRYDVYLSRN